jgi:hypothetical protein
VVVSLSYSVQVLMRLIRPLLSAPLPHSIVRYLGLQQNIENVAFVDRNNAREIKVDPATGLLATSQLSPFEEVTMSTDWILC